MASCSQLKWSLHKERKCTALDFKTVMQELEALGKERTKKIYISNGAQEPVFGVATGAMKPIDKKNKNKPKVSRRTLCHRQLRCYVFCRHYCGPESYEGV